MAAQTEGRTPGRVGSEAIPVNSPTPLDVAAAVTIYGGSLVFVNSAGRAVALSPDQTMSCAGYAENDVDNSAGSNGTLTITPRIGCISLVNGDGIVAADVGKMAFASDNQTANLSSSSNTRCPIGPIIGLDGSRVFVLAGYPLSREVASYTSLSAIPVLTSTASGSLSAEVNLGALTTGLLKHTVSAGVSTPATAVAGTDYTVPATLAAITNGNGAALVGIEDTATFYAGAHVESALAALGTALGGTNSTTRNFTNNTVVADNDSFFTAVDKLDTKFTDLASTANAKGASLVGVEDSSGFLAATTVEAALAEIAKFNPALLADPGTAQAIPVTRSATIEMTIGAGAETNTLAIPAFVGQTMRLYCGTIGGGTRAITAASAVNVAGNTIMTFNAARDYIVLNGVSIGGTRCWEVAFNANVALS